MTQRHVVFTIAGRNYLAQAIILHATLIRHNPDVAFHTVLCDTCRDKLDETLGHCPSVIQPAFRQSILCLDELEHPSVFDMQVRYTPVEFATSVKPSCFLLLARRFPGSLISYFDPDIEVFRRLSQLEDFMSRHSITLMPHVSIPPEDAYGCTTLTIQKTGIFNFGYVGMNAAYPVAIDALHWWQRRLEHDCRVNVANSIFVDQKWGNFFACRDDSGVFMDPGHNVAYWNLHERTVSLRDGGYYANDVPITFFHYSGYNPKNPELLSKYQDRHVLWALPAVLALCENYRSQLMGAGFAAWSSLGFKSQGDPAKTALLALGSNAEEILQTERRLYGKCRSRLRGMARLKRAPGGLVAGLSLLYLALHHITVAGRRGGRIVERVGRRLPGAFEVPEKALVWLLGSGGPRPAAEEPEGAMSAESSVSGAPATALPKGADVRQPTLALAGYLTAEMGVGEGGRGLVRALDRAGLECDLYDIGGHYARKRHQEFSDRVRSVPGRANPYALGLVCVNADQLTEQLLGPLGDVLRRCEKRVGYWFWETGQFPQRWAHRSNYLSEVWAATNFIADGLRESIKVPVRVVPPAMTVTPDSRFGREQFGIPSDRTIFLNIFDAKSFPERKNTFGLIDSFRHAFAQFPDAARRSAIVIKSNNLPAAVRSRLAEMAADLPMIFLDDYMDRDALLGLVNVSDCYISLHRAEGLGLPLIEAMMLGKSTIATAYSGNTDFMTPENSLLVDYTLIPAAGEVGPYQGSVWANPDPTHAARQILRVLQEPDAVRDIAARGQREVIEHFSPDRCAAIIREAIGELGIEVR